MVSAASCCVWGGPLHGLEQDLAIRSAHNLFHILLNGQMDLVSDYVLIILFQFLCNICIAHCIRYHTKLFFQVIYIPWVLTKAEGSLAMTAKTKESFCKDKHFLRYMQIFERIFESHIWSFIFIGRNYTEIICWYRYGPGIWLHIVICNRLDPRAKV